MMMKAEQKELGMNGKGGIKEKISNFGFVFDVRDRRVVDNNAFSKIQTFQGP